MKLDLSSFPEEYNKKLSKPILFALLFLVLISFLALVVIFILKDKIEENKNQYLTELTIYRAGTIKERIKDDFSDVEAISKLISSKKDVDYDVITNIMGIENNLNNFKTMGIADKYGNATTTDLKRANIKNREFFQRALAGEKYVVCPSVVSVFDKKVMTVLAMPVYKFGSSTEVEKVLFATIEKSKYAKVLHLPTLNIKSYTYIIKMPSQRIEYSDEDFIDYKLDLPEISKILDKYSSITVPKIRTEVSKNESGVKMAKINNQKFYLSFSPVGFNNWYVVNISPREPFSTEYSILLFTILGFFTLLFCIVLYLFASYFIAFVQIFQTERSLKKINDSICRTFILDKLKNKIVKEVAELFGADNCIIKDYDVLSETFCFNRLGICTSTVLPKKHIYYSSRFDNISLKNNNYVIENLEHFIKSNNLENDEYSKMLLENGYVYCVNLPINYNGVILGMLSLNFKRTYNINQYEIALLNLVATQIAMATKQARLYSKTTENAKQERLLKDILALSCSDLNLDEIFNNICKKLVETFGITGVKIVESVDIKRQSYKEYGYIRSKKINKIVEIKLIWDMLKYWFDETADGNIKLINDIQKSGLPEAMKDIFINLGIKSVGCIPIKIFNTQIYIFLANHFVTKNWTENNLETMYLVKDYISILLKEKGLYNEAQFVSNISHELKTPLTIINSFNELLRIDENTTESQLKSIEKIQKNIDRMNNLIEDILYVSKINNKLDSSKANLEPCNLTKVIENSIEQCSVFAKSKNISLNSDLQSDVVMKMDSSLLQQAFINLINNSIKYSDNDKVINIELATTQQEIIIKFADQGCGIAENDLKNIFKKFYRVDNSRSRETGGVGLGLMMVQQIIDFHKGFIKTESVLKKGTTFTITFIHEAL